MGAGASTARDELAKELQAATPEDVRAFCAASSEQLRDEAEQRISEKLRAAVEEAAQQTADVELQSNTVVSNSSTRGEASAELSAAIEAAATAQPLPPAGQFAESWDGGETFHWSGLGKAPIPAGSAREAAEKRALKAIQAIDAADIAAHTRPKDISSYYGVRVGWLKGWLKGVESLDRALKTHEVVELFIKPQTASRRCRYVEVLEPSEVGEAHLSISHTWGSPFSDLVATVTQVATDDMFVWLDIFAVSRADVQPARMHRSALVLCSRLTFSNSQPSRLQVRQWPPNTSLGQHSHPRQPQVDFAADYADRAAPTTPPRPDRKSADSTSSPRTEERRKNIRRRNFR